MSNNCQFYFIKRQELHSETITKNRNPSKPSISNKAFCTHKESVHKQETSCPAAICGGDTIFCDLPEPHRSCFLGKDH